MLIGLMLTLGLSLKAQEQKIGYISLDAVMSLMPEMKAVNEELGKFSEQLQAGMKVKQDYAEVKYREFLEMGQDTLNPPSQEVMQAKQQELLNLRQEIEAEAQKADRQLALKRNELMAPVAGKLQEEMNKLADAKGYSIILNSVDGSGTSVILFGPEEHNLTKPLLTQMGIEVPEADSSSK